MAALGKFSTRTCRHCFRQNSRKIVLLCTAVHLNSSSFRKLFFFLSDSHCGRLFPAETLYTCRHKEASRQRYTEPNSAPRDSMLLCTLTPSGAETFILSVQPGKCWHISHGYTSKPLQPPCLSPSPKPPVCLHSGSASSWRRQTSCRVLRKPYMLCARAPRPAPWN